MEAFGTTLIASIGAFLIGSASAVSSDSAFKSNDVRIAGFAFPLARDDRAHGDPDAPAGYLPLGIAKINGMRFSINASRTGRGSRRSRRGPGLRRRVR
jgi:hypothetical protein